MTRTILFTLAFLLGTVSAAVSRDRGLQGLQLIDGSQPGEQFPTGDSPGVLGATQQQITYFGGTVWAPDSMRWEALPDSMWTFDTGVGSHFNLDAPGVDPFKLSGLHAAMEGWVGWDLSFSDTPYFRRVSMTDFAGGNICVGDAAFGAGVGGNYSFYAGLLPSEAGAACYASGQGYGNLWNVCMAQTFSYDGMGPVTLEYDFVNDTELWYDWTQVYVDTSGSGDGSEDVEVFAYTGPAAGHASLVLGPGQELPETPKDIRVSFCVTSDISYSDQDGFYESFCGAFAVDNLSVQGGGISHSTDFETGEDGWTLLPPAPGPGGDWSNLVSVNDLPPPLTSCECPLQDSVLVFEDLSAGGHGNHQDNLAVSPWIDLGRYGLGGVPGRDVYYDTYVDLPVLNYTFISRGVQWYPYVCEATGEITISPWVLPFTYVFGGPACWDDGGLGLTSITDGTSTQFRVALGVTNFCRFAPACSGVTNSSPWFDNIRVAVYGNPNAPLLTMSGFARPQDSFPENGSLQIDAPGRLEAAGATGPKQSDNFFVNGGEGGAEVRVQFAVDPGPGINQTRLADWLAHHPLEEIKDGLAWYSARMDSDEVQGRPIPVWVTRYHEEDPNFSGNDQDLDPTDIDPEGNLRLANDIFPDDLLTPGSRLMFFYKNRFEGGTTWFTEPDTTGGNYLDLDVLPSSMTADTTFNCVLFVNKYHGADLIQHAMGNILPGGSANFENTAWDRFDAGLPPTPGTATFGRPLNSEWGATVTQALGYKTILWNAHHSFSLVKEDADILIPWLTLVGFPYNNLYIAGDDAASWMTLNSAAHPSSRTLLEDFAGVFWSCGTFREVGCPAGTPEDASPCLNIDPVEGARVTDPLRAIAHMGYGNGCPEERSFDVLATNPNPSFGVALPDEEYVGGVKTAQYASITNDAEAQGSRTYKTVVDGISLHHRRDFGNCVAEAGNPAAVEQRLREVLTWFGYTGGPPLCRDLTSGVGLEPGRVPGQVLETTLRPAAPNPLRSGSTARIRFTLARGGRALVEIFDVNGRRVKRLFDGPARGGETEVVWDGTDGSGRSVAGGVYFYRLEAGGEEYSRKLVVIRTGG